MRRALIRQAVEFKVDRPLIPARFRLRRPSPLGVEGEEPDRTGKEYSALGLHAVDIRPMQCPCRYSHGTAHGGFTLVELVIVIVVLGLLGAVAVPRFIDFSDSAKEATTRDILGDVRSAIASRSLKNALQDGGGDARYPTLEELMKSMGGEAPPNPYSRGDKPGAVVEAERADKDYGAEGGWAYDPKTGEFWAHTTTAPGKESSW